jgi:mannonate dehydratase
VGICLCCGTWLEGGKALTEKDPEETIHYFGARKIWKIHFRTVSAPLPHFVETLMEDGYYGMYKIMKATNAAKKFLAGRQFPLVARRRSRQDS